jgi:hypothetical protein
VESSAYSWVQSRGRGCTLVTSLPMPDHLGAEPSCSVLRGMIRWTAQVKEDL